MGAHVSLPVPDAAEIALSSLPEEDRLLILSLRFWLRSHEAQSEVWSAYAARFGPAKGRAALKAFEAFLNVVAEGAARRLRHRPAGCACAAEDEVLLAAMARHAACGEIAPAYACASMLMRPECATRAVCAAGDLGRWLILRAPPPSPRTLH